MFEPLLGPETPQFESHWEFGFHLNCEDCVSCSDEYPDIHISSLGFLCQSRVGFGDCMTCLREIQIASSSMATTVSYSP